MSTVRLSVTFNRHTYDSISAYAAATGQTKSAVINEILHAASGSLDTMTDLIIQLQTASEEKRLSMKNELSMLADNASKAVGGVQRSLSLVSGSAGDSTPT